MDFDCFLYHITLFLNNTTELVISLPKYSCVLEQLPLVFSVSLRIPGPTMDPRLQGYLDAIRQTSDPQITSLIQEDSMNNMKNYDFLAPPDFHPPIALHPTLVFFDHQATTREVSKYINVKLPAAS